MTWSKRERAVLEDRASRMHRARRPEPPVTRPEAIVVSVAGELVALPGSAVHAIRRLSSLTVVHCGPPAMVGVFAMGPLVLPAFRLASLIGRAPLPAERPHVLVLGKAGPELGVEVESIVGVDALQLTPLLESPFDLAICGRTPSEVPVLAPEALLSSPRIGPS